MFRLILDEVHRHTIEYFYDYYINYQTVQILASIVLLCVLTTI